MAGCAQYKRNHPFKQIRLSAAIVLTKSSVDGTLATTLAETTVISVMYVDLGSNV